MCLVGTPAVKAEETRRLVVFAYGTITLFGIPFQEISANSQFYHFMRNFVLGTKFPASLSFNCSCAKHKSSRLSPFSLAATKGIDNCFIFLRVLECFASPGTLAEPRRAETRNHAENFSVVLRIVLHSSACRGFTATGFPIRTPRDQRLLDTSSGLIAVTPRPSSPQSSKASTINL